jgi:hypothetical protein
MAAQKAELMKIGILGYDREALPRGILPNGIVVGAPKPDVPNVVAVREDVGQRSDESVR